jgi:hypothetical protein
MKNNADFVSLLFQLFYKKYRYNSKIIVTRFADVWQTSSKKIAGSQKN